MQLPQVSTSLAIRSTQRCGDVLVNGGVAAAIDAIGVIPAFGEGWDVAHTGIDIASTAVALHGGNGVGLGIGTTGIALQFLGKNKALLEGVGEDIPVAGRVVAAGATAWDLFQTARDYAQCRGW